MRELLHELKDVTEWFELGIYLGIPDSKLREIHEDNDNIEECKAGMILVWSQQRIPTWRALVTALVGIDMCSLAMKIAEKHGESFSYFADNFITVTNILYVSHYHLP